MDQLTEVEVEKLGAFAKALVNQQAAKVIIPPQAAQPGFWFGGGNMIEDAEGNLLVVGRYRNRGDSRTGLHAGERGLELAIFRSENRGASFEKMLSFGKTDLAVPDKECCPLKEVRCTGHLTELSFLSPQKNLGSVTLRV